MYINKIWIYDIIKFANGLSNSVRYYQYIESKFLNDMMNPNVNLYNLCIKCIRFKANYPRLQCIINRNRPIKYTAVENEDYYINILKTSDTMLYRQFISYMKKHGEFKYY